MNLFYSNFNKSDSDIILDEIDSKHLSKSLRKKVGDIIRVTNGEGIEIKGEIIRLGKNIKVKIINRRAIKPNSSIILSIGLTPKFPVINCNTQRRLGNNIKRKI